MDVNIQTFIENLGSSETLIRLNARQHLLELGRQIVDTLIDEMAKSQGRQKWELARVLAEIEDIRCVPVLTELLKSGDPLLSPTAVTGLERYDKEISVPILLTYLSSSPLVTQLQIVRALSSLNHPYAISPLIALLQQTDSNEVRYNTIEALGKLGAVESIDVILSYENDENHHVRKRARNALDYLRQIESYSKP